MTNQKPFEILQEIANFYWSEEIDTIPKDLNILLNCFFKIISPLGLKNLDNIKIPTHLQTFYSFCNNFSEYLSIPFYITKLTFFEIPKSKTIFFESLYFTKAHQYFFPFLIENIQNNFILTSLTTLLLTYIFRVVNICPEFNFKILIKSLEINLNLLYDQNHPFLIEFMFISIDFLDSSSTFLNENFLFDSIFPLISWNLCRNIYKLEDFYEINNNNYLTSDEIDDIYFSPEKLSLFEKIFQICFNEFENNYLNSSSYYYLIITFIQFCVSITSQKEFGRPLSVFLSFYFNDDKNQIQLLYEIGEKIPIFFKKIKSLIYQLNYNINFLINLKNFPFTLEEFYFNIGFNQVYFNVDYLIDLLSSNVYIPKLQLTYLDINNYFITSYLLYKHTLALNIWEDLNENKNSLSSRLFEIHIRQVQNSYFIPKKKILFGEYQFLLLNIIENVILKIAFVIKKFENNNEFGIEFLSGKPNIDYNYLFILDPKISNSFEFLKNTLIYKDQFPNSPLTQLWLGQYDINTFYQEFYLNDFKNNQIDFGGVIKNPSDLMSVLLEAKNIYQITPSFQCEDFFDNQIYLKFPKDRKKFFKAYYLKVGSKPISETINYTINQQLAVFSSLTLPLTIIQGPPGTGKSETMLSIVKILNNNLNIINQDFNPDNNERILILAHSNFALDQMTLAILNSGIDVFRYGNNFSLKNSDTLIQNSSLEGRLLQLIYFLIDSFNNIPQLNIYISEILSFLENKIPFTYEDFIDFLDFFSDLLTVLSHFSQYDSFLTLINNISKKKARKYFLDKIGIISSTISNSSLKLLELNELNINTIIIEESAKILETEMITFLLLHPKRLIFIGDHNQISPIISSDDIRYYGKFDISLFERFIKLNIPNILLTHQGRSIKEIANLYRFRYKYKLVDLPSVKSIPKFFIFDSPLQWVNISKTSLVSENMQNLDECLFILNLLLFLNNSNFNLNYISILTPYKNQKKLLIEQIQKKLNFNNIFTVDEYQGLQNYIIFLSLVSPTPSIWLRDPKRILVLSSRARSNLIFFGNLKGFSSSFEWEEIIDKIDSPGSLLINGQIINKPEQLLFF